MPIKLLRENVDIYTVPIFSLKSEYMHDDKNEYTIGDLHGNAIKLLYFLIKQGIVKNIDGNDYNKLVYIYKKPVDNLGKSELNLFKNIIKKIKCTKNPNSIVRLIGDELADRGSNDYFTLKILQKIHQEGVPLEILVSNHSAEFIKAYELQQINPHNKFSSRYLDARFITSMANLQTLIEKGLVDKKEIFTIYEKVYTPNLKLIAYTQTFSKSKQPEIVLYTHAPAGLESIKAIADEFNIPYKDGSLHQLTHTINKINTEFQEQYAQKNSVRELFEEENPVYTLIWNRRYEKLERSDQKANYKLNFVHGHDAAELSQKNIYNLDTDLGKCEKCNKGEYSVFRITLDEEYKAEKEFTKKVPKEKTYSPISYDPTWLPRHVSKDITTLMQYANTCRRAEFFRYKDMSKNPITPVIEVSQSINDAILTLTRC
jgi:hypothetical protein